MTRKLINFSGEDNCGISINDLFCLYYSEYLTLYLSRNNKLHDALKAQIYENAGYWFKNYVQGLIYGFSITFLFMIGK